jgi:hypothetical protein
MYKIIKSDKNRILLEKKLVFMAETEKVNILNLYFEHDHGSGCEVALAKNGLKKQVKNKFRRKNT